MWNYLLSFVLKNRTSVAGLAAALIVGIACLIGVHKYGKRQYAAGEAKGQAAIMKRALKAEEALAKVEHYAAQQALVHEAKIKQANIEYQILKEEQAKKGKVQYVEVQKIVEKPVYRQHCFDDAGLSELKRAIKGG